MFIHEHEKLLVHYVNNTSYRHHFVFICVHNLMIDICDSYLISNFCEETVWVLICENNKIDFYDEW
jgi:hypothetical protein